MLRMNEYATEWPESKVKEFLTLDQNGDGVITAAECMAALNDGFKPGLVTSSSSVGAPSSLAPGASASTTVLSSTYTESQGATAPAASGVDPRYVSFAQRLIESSRVGIFSAR